MTKGPNCERKFHPFLLHPNKEIRRETLFAHTFKKGISPPPPLFVRHSHCKCLIWRVAGALYLSAVFFFSLKKTAGCRRRRRVSRDNQKVKPIYSNRLPALIAPPLRQTCEELIYFCSEKNGGGRLTFCD